MIYYIGFSAISKVLPVGKEASTILFIGPLTSWESPKRQHGHQCLTLVSKCDCSAVHWTSSLLCYATLLIICS